MDEKNETYNSNKIIKGLVVALFIGYTIGSIAGYNSAMKDICKAFSRVTFRIRGGI